MRYEGEPVFTFLHSQSLRDAPKEFEKYQMRRRHIGKEPEYRSKQQEAAEYLDQTKRHQENINAISSLSNRIAEATTQQQAAEKSKRIREWITIGVLTATAAGAIALLVVTQRSSKQQHDDTISALSKTDSAISETTRLANETKRAADIAQKNLVLSRRPWLTYKSIEMKEPLTIIKDNQVKLTLTTSAKNIGQTPALGVDFKAELFLITTPDLAHPSELVDQYLCRLSKNTPIFSSMPSVFGKIIMPNDTVDLAGGHIRPLDPLPPLDIARPESEHRMYLISVCISYNDEFATYGIGQLFYYLADNPLPSGEIPGRLIEYSGKVLTEGGRVL